MRARACERCPELAATRKTVVFGAGNADAELMFVGEAPGANEDEQGLPFVGRAGELLDQLLEEIALERAKVWIGNVLKCRPPGNRDPQPVEIENCQEYLLRQVELIEPTVICTLGNFSTKLLRGDPTGITRLHGQPEVMMLGAGRCGCTRSITPPPRSTRRGCWRRCGKTSPASPSCSCSGPPEQPAPQEVRPRSAPEDASRAPPAERGAPRGLEPDPAAAAPEDARPSSWACSEPSGRSSPSRRSGRSFGLFQTANQAYLQTSGVRANRVSSRP